MWSAVWIALLLFVFWWAGAIVGYWAGVRRTWQEVNRICAESGYAAVVRKVDARKGAGS
jgi:hypothetical protein